ncbi:MAG: multidrug effflux MFS transporter [Pseudomonadota bacterium]
MSDQQASLGAVIWLDRATPPHIITLVLMSGVAAMSMNVFLPSLPSMAADFGADYRLVQLAVSGYLAVTAAVQLILGPLSDRYGRRPVVLGAIILFILASLACIVAPTIETFLAARFAQAGIATGIVLSRAIVRDMVPTDQAASMIGYVTMGMALVPMISPMIGGVLEQAFGWRSNFVFMLGAGLLLLLITLRDLGETNLTPSTRLTDQFRAYPELAQSRRFWGYAFTAAFAAGSFFAFLGGAPYIGARVYGLDPATTGFYFGFIAVGFMAGNFLTGRYTQRLGLDRMMMLGTLVAVVSLLLACLLNAWGALHPLAFFIPVMGMGLGNGLTMPNASAGSVSVRPHLAGSASGLSGTLMVGGGAVISAATGMFLGEDVSAWPLLLMMTASAVLAFICACYVIWVARRRGPLAGTAQEL